LTGVTTFREAQAIGDGQGFPVGGTALHKGPLFLAQLVFAALSHRQCMVLNRGGVERRVYREKVFQRLRRQAVGHQGGPLRLHEEQLGGDRVGQQGI
jgi:1,6-anhydro-N-acetylmuramate kinase